MAPKKRELPSWGEEARAKASRASEANGEKPDWKLSEDELQTFLNEDSPVRILMTGSRTWTDRRAIAGSIRRALKFLGREPEQATLIHGAAQGADKLAESIAVELGLRTEAHPADWNTHNSNCPKTDPGNGSCWQGLTKGGRTYCKRAGFRRNQEMIDSGVDILLAFIQDESRGASGTLNIWLKDNGPTILCRQDSDGPVKGEFLNMDSWD